MQRHCENGMAVAQFLETHPKAGLMSTTAALHPAPIMRWPKKYLPKGSCGVVSFGLRGPRSRQHLYEKPGSLPPSRPRLPEPGVQQHAPPDER